MSKLYNDLAEEWYQLLTPLAEYKEEADLYHQYFTDTAVPIRTMLELGGGAGHNAHFLKQWYRMTITDLSAEMLNISKRINPDCEHSQGDMRTLRLDKTFDAVFIHDAIMYMTTPKDLEKALVTAAVHLESGGVVLVTPDFIRENYKNNTDHGGEDGEGKSLRFIEWANDPDTKDTEVNVDYIYALKDTKGKITIEQDNFIEGLFSQEQWLAAMDSAGFVANVLEDIKYNRINFLGVKK